MTNAKEFWAVMKEYIDFLEQGINREKEKYAALVSYDPKRTDRIVAEQQAANMRLAQLEERRESAQKEAGWEGLTFQEILNRLEDEKEKEEKRQLLIRFERAVEEVRYYNGRAIAFANDGLRMLGKFGESLQPGTYDSAGRQKDKGKTITLFETEV